MRATLCCSARASYLSGFCYCREQALGDQASAVATHRLSSVSQLLLGMWNLPGPEMEPMSPALAGRFLFTVPLGRSPIIQSFYYVSAANTDNDKLLSTYRYS